VTVKQKEFGVKGPEVTIIGEGTWYIDRGDRKSAVAALRVALVQRIAWAEDYFKAVIPGWSEGPDLRCAIAHRGISRFSDVQLPIVVRAFARPGMTVGG
jgi:hypothetical protein